MIYPLAACTLVLALFAPQPSAPLPLDRAEVASAAPLPGVALISIDGWTCYAAIGETLIPIGPYEDAAGDPLAVLMAPGSVEISYLDRHGNTVTVKMPCSNFQTEEACARAAQKQLEATQKVIPKFVPPKQD